MTDSDNPTQGNANSTSLSEEQAADKLDAILSDEPWNPPAENVKEQDQEEPVETEADQSEEVEAQEAETEPEVTEEDTGQDADSEDDAEEGEGTEEAEEEQVVYDIPDDYEFEIDGERKTLSQLKADTKQVKELQRGFTRKTEELKVDREKVETKAQQVLQKADELRLQGETLLAGFQTFVGAEPTPPSESVETDPMGHMQFNADLREYQQKVNQYWQLHGQLQQQAEKAQNEAQKAREDAMAAEWEAVQEKRPHLRDETTFNSVRSEIIDNFVEAYGFNKDQIDAVLKSEVMPVILDANEFIKLQKETPKTAAKVKKKPPLVKAGKRQSPEGQKARDTQDAFSRHRKDKSVHSAVALLDTLDLDL